MRWADDTQLATFCHTKMASIIIDTRFNMSLTHQQWLEFWEGRNRCEHWCIFDARRFYTQFLEIASMVSTIVRRFLTSTIHFRFKISTFYRFCYNFSRKSEWCTHLNFRNKWSCPELWSLIQNYFVVIKNRNWINWKEYFELNILTIIFWMFQKVRIICPYKCW